MPRELRNIYFDESELKIALMQFSARQKLIFNVENINDVDVKEGPPISVSLKVFDLETGKVGTVNYSNPEIAAALMGYCMFLKIPLPRSGKKSIAVKDDALILKIKIQ